MKETKVLSLRYYRRDETFFLCEKMCLNIGLIKERQLLFRTLMLEYKISEEVGHCNKGDEVNNK